MKKCVYVFHHTDLDGMGVKILGILYARQRGLACKTIPCSYGKVNQEVCQAIKVIDDMEEIIIGDISVNEDTAERLEDVYRDGLPIRLRDHHDSADWLNKYEWAIVKEADDGGIARCGTWWLAQDEDMKKIRDKLSVVINAIDQWDTWKWKESRYMPARQLNSLLSILGQDDFVQYILENQDNFKSDKDLFTERMEIMLETYNRQIENQVALCEKFMYTMNLWTQVPDKKPGVQRKLKKTVKLYTGIVFLNNELSAVGDAILDKHPELDVLMILAFPGMISWRTQKELPISLAKIAKRATGFGGGHPSAAGSTISFSSFKDILTKFMDANFANTLDFSNIKSAWERNYEAEQKRLEAEAKSEER